MKIMIPIVTFTTGVIVGAFISKTRLEYAQLAEEEIESTKAAYAKMHRKENARVSEPDTPDKGVFRTVETKRDIQDYRKIAEKYKDQLNRDDSHKSKAELATEIYIIEEVEFDKNDEYDKICLEYYVDDAVLVEDDVPIEMEEIFGIIGDIDLAWEFREKAHQIVYVRNENIKIDYEISRIDSAWKEVVDGY